MIHVEGNAAYAGMNEAWVGYDNRAVSVSASSENPDNPAENTLDGNTFDHWSPASSGNRTLTFTTSGTIDYIAIAAHTADTACNSITITANGSTVYTVSQFDGRAPIIVHTVERSATTWALTFNGAASTLQVGVVHVGRLLQMQRTEYDGFTPPNLNRDETRIPSMSESGHYLGQLLTRSFCETKASWEHLEPDWYRANMEPFAKETQTRAFFLAWRPSDFPRDVVYGWRTSRVEPKNSGPAGLMSTSFDMTAVSND